MPSTGPFVIFVSRYARMPSACFRIVRPSFTNGVRLDRAAHSSHSSSSAGASSGVACPRIESLAAGGASLVEMQTAGRWQSPAMPGHYARGQLAARGAVARVRYGRG